MSKVALSPEKEPQVHTDIDKVYEMIEGRGWYKYLVLVATCITFLSHMYYLFGVPFFLVRPTVHCNLGGYWHECTQEEVCNNEDVAYRFDKPIEFNFLTEFNWYCDDVTPSFFTATAFFLGTTFSVLLVSNLSDMFGRLPLLILGTVGELFALALLMLFAGPYMCFVSSFLIGFFTMAGNSGSFNYLADSVQEKYRESLPTILNIGWATGEALLSGIMWTGIQWRGMFLFMFIFAACFFIPLFWLRESPRFYHSQNKMRLAQARLKTMASINGVDVSHIKLAPDLSKKAEDEEVTFCQRLKLMCCDLTMFKQIMLVAVMFGSGNMIFYAMTLNLENMGGNIYLNGTLIAVSEIVACLTSGLSLKIMNPRVALSGCFILSVIGVVGLIFFWFDPLWSIVFCVIGKLGSAGTDNLIYTLSGILFPTEILGGALGIALLGTRFGNLIAKPIYLVGHDRMCMIMAGLGIASSVLPCFLTIRSDEKKEAKDPDTTTEKL